MAQDAATYRHLKIIAGADSFGAAVKDAAVAHLRSLGVDVEDLGTDKYYSVAEEIGRRISSAAGTGTGTATASPTATQTLGLVACGTGVGVSIFANKFPGVFAATCLSPGDALNARSINNSNVLALSGMSTSPETAIEILNTWLNTPFKSPCPASDSKPWPSEIESFLDQSVPEMSQIGSGGSGSLQESSLCGLCDLAKGREFAAINLMPGGHMKIVRETPTSAIVRFKAGSVEPAHHHTFGHDLVVMKGRKKVWNLSKGESWELEVGDFLFTPAGDKHRVKYLEDTEFFIKWDGRWDLLLDEDLDAANAALEKESL
ncbi:hypothetical protein RJ639_014158 [Escallonia herrerae]|uniref:Cupin type-2 domain-containing protein n=1 Tax=Escallonia herrerae TaxID=1293975 RepID=A0AA88VF80_9ASTE|nr:hypothetical protein RJ639_014158 [Escallonia herrerae]